MGDTEAAVRRITPPTLGDPAAAERVIAALRAGAAEVRYVGGCVRDSLLDRPLTDIDMATPAPPERVMELLQEAGLKVVPTGVSHGTVMAISGGYPFEITTLRKDVETDGRHAVVAFTDCWKADAARRDLTMNALSCDPEGRLYDYFGGVQDLEAGRIRFIGSPDARIAEDYLRLLRFYRFLAHYGRERPNEVALRATTEAAPQLATLSGERVRVELLKLLDAPEPEKTLGLMAEQGILPHLLPDPLAVDRLERLRHMEEGATDPLLRLAALLPADPQAAERTCERLRLSRAEARRLEALCQPAPFGEFPPARKDLRRALHERGADLVGDQLRVTASRLGENLPREAWAMVESWEPKSLPIRGADLLAAGFEGGPALGRLLRQLEDWWLEEERRPDREALLEKAHSLRATEGRISR